MGLFDWLFGRKQPPTNSATAAKPPMTPEAALTGLFAPLGASQLRRDPDNDDAFEVRGAFAGRPARVRLDERHLTIAVKAALGARAVVLIRDATRVPKPADPDPHWGDDDVRVFVAPAIYTEGRQELVDLQLGVLAGLSPARRAALFAAMDGSFRAKTPIVFAATSDGLTLSAYVELDEIAPVAPKVLAVLAPLADELAALPDPLLRLRVGAPSAGPPPAIVRCDYCRSRFVPAWDLKCPNCGAPAP